MPTPDRYLKPRVYELLASNYVTGLLRGRARKRFVGLMQHHPEIGRAVHMWEQKLDPLNNATPPREPAPEVWQFLSQAIGAETPKASRLARFLDGFKAQNWFGWTSFAASLVLAVILVWQQDQTPPLVNYVAIMENLQGSVPIVATSSKETRELILDMAEVPELPERTLMLWAISKTDGSIASLGAVPAAKRSATPLDDAEWELIKNAHSLMLTAEPKDILVASVPSQQVVARGLCVAINYDKI